MKFTSLAALTVATVGLANVSPATAASMKYDLQIHGIGVESGILGGSTTINAAAGSFTTNDSMDAIESVALKLGNLQFNQGEFLNNGTSILFSNSAQPSQSLTLFALPPLPQEIGDMVGGQAATLANGTLTDSVSYKITKLASVPEPLTILGSAAALGFGFVLKQENSRKKNKVN
ncbi:PEP-CTERM sorting domain-containing protein [Coleofasciculus sp. G2-EDA-02]|uniref:PEP-CTERM sorting domain-containing protein n=1 Tax=Coleofasciculus sp. G2-EDA-02 TaxID=3069529 RepID=UPI003301AAFE